MLKKSKKLVTKSAELASSPAKIVKLPKPQVIFTDWDDTMFNNVFYCEKAIENLVIKHVKDVRKSAYPTDPRISLCANVTNLFRSTVGLPLGKSLHLLFSRDEVAIEKDFKSFYQKAKEDFGIKMLDGAADTIRMINKLGIPLIGISNKEGVIIRGEVAKSGMMKYFSLVLGQDDVPHPKPSTDPMEVALVALSKKGEIIRPQNCLYLGDSPVDVEFAKNSGLHPIIIGEMQYLNAEGRRMMKAGKLVHVNNHKEMQIVIQRAFKSGAKTMVASKQSKAVEERVAKKIGIKKASLGGKMVVKNSKAKPSLSSSVSQLKKVAGNYAGSMFGVGLWTKQQKVVKSKKHHKGRKTA